MPELEGGESATPDPRGAVLFGSGLALPIGDQTMVIPAAAE